MLSLDVGGGKIRVVIGKAKQNTAVIEDYFEADTGDVSLQSEGAPKLLGDILQNAISGRGITETKCVAPISGADVFFRRTGLPKSNPRRIREMILHSLSEISAIKDYYIDYMVEREYLADGKKMLDVIICGAPKDLVASYYLLVEAAGLTPYHMDARQNCIHRLLNETTRINGESLMGKSVLLLDAGSSFLGADLVADAKSVFERTVSIQLQPDVSEGLGAVSFDGAHADESNRLYAKISEETQKMTQFSLSRALKSPVTRIYLYGENSTDTGLAAYLTDSLGIAAEALREITGLTLDEGYNGPEFCSIFGFAAALI